MLAKREPGFIFPAFPENGLFAFMKSKVTVAKDEAFVATRTRVIERFFTRYADRLTLRQAVGLEALMELADNDLLDLLFARVQPEAALDRPEVRLVLEQLRARAAA